MTEEAQYRVIIAGSRTFTDRELLYRTMDRWAFGLPEGTIEVLSGTARGADTLGEQWAREREIPLTRFKPRWKRHGPAAGPIRNEQMANRATHLVAFRKLPDGTPGTNDMLARAKRHGLHVLEVDYEEKEAEVHTPGEEQDMVQGTLIPPENWRPEELSAAGNAVIPTEGHDYGSPPPPPPNWVLPQGTSEVGEPPGECA